MIQELSDDFYIPTNEFQTQITKEYLLTLPEEVAEQLLDFTQNIEYIRNLISDVLSDFDIYKHTFYFLMG